MAVDMPAEMPVVAAPAREMPLVEVGWRLARPPHAPRRTPIHQIAIRRSTDATPHIARTQIAAVLRRELGLSATAPLKPTVDEACVQLGIPTDGGNLLERARRCYALLGPRSWAP